MSRQREQQKKLRAEGRCRRCWQPAPKSSRKGVEYQAHCQPCAQEPIIVRTFIHGKLILKPKQPAGNMLRLNEEKRPTDY